MKKLTTAQFIEIAKVVHGETYLYHKVVYIKSLQKVIIVCNIHGDFSQRPNDHISGKNGCPFCKSQKIGNLKRAGRKEVLERFRVTHGDRFDYSTVSYINMRKKILVGCTVHGPFLISPEKHISGQGCSKCKMSSGESMVATSLIELGIGFETEKKFPDAKNISWLRFDFYLPEFNALIEYDGEQHKMLSSVFRNSTCSKDEILERFLKTVENDCIKNSFANQHKMYLLRIPYTARTTQKIKGEIVKFLETVKCDPENLDSTGSYIIASG